MGTMCKLAIKKKNHFLVSQPMLAFSYAVSHSHALLGFYCLAYLAMFTLLTLVLVSIPTPPCTVFHNSQPFHRTKSG